MRPPPLTIAAWLGLAYAAAIAVFLIGGADAEDARLLSIFFIPWIVGPAALAAIGAKLSGSRAGEWTFLGLEAAVIASTAAGWWYLIVVAPDPQNGFAMALTIPFAQYAAVGVFYGLFFALDAAVRRRG